MITPVRRCLLIALLSAAGSILTGAEVERVHVNHEYVSRLAEQRSKKPFHPPKNRLPDFLEKLTYDDYQRIRFITERSLWSADNLPFRVQFFHPGNIFQQHVRINEFAGDFSQRIPFVRNYFDYQDLNLPGRLPGSLDYAGFRILAHLNAPDRFDELISFLGASYYRALGQRHRYGISARGLAVDYGLPRPEEFPHFDEFWLGKVEPEAKSVKIHALLDSHSVTGAYTFDVTPGPTTTVNVRATLFFRKKVEVLGLAPLTSMYWFGENSSTYFGDFREEVHDSDGLLVATEGDARLWRPLDNPREVHVTTYPCTDGFGLLQRDRDYYNYVDPEARYESRPSVWVRATSPWPPGHVRLLEIPTADEYHDNMVAAFVPNEVPAAGESLDYSYEQLWTSDQHFGGPPAWVSSTRRTARVENHPMRSHFVIDFDPAGMADVPADADVTAEIHVPAPARYVSHNLFRNDIDGSWRLSLYAEAPPEGAMVEVTVRLLRDGQPLSETWTTTWKQQP